MQIKTEGLVLKTTDTGESDRLVTILTRDFGLLRAFANGAKRLKSRSQSATQPLAFSRFSLYRGRDAYTVDEAQGIELFFPLREDIVRLSLAQYFCELAAELAPAEVPAEPCLRLLLQALYLLSHQKKPLPLLKAAVELRMLCFAGYMPDLNVCASCARPDLPGEFVLFSLEEGTFHCADCGGNGTPIGMGVLAAMRHICRAEGERLFSFRLPEPSLRALNDTTEAYITAQLQRRFQTLAFYKGLL